MYNHGITITHDYPDWDYCSWECKCGKFSGVDQIEWAFMTAAEHMDEVREESRNAIQV